MPPHSDPLHAAGTVFFILKKMDMKVFYKVCLVFSIFLVNNYAWAQTVTINFDTNANWTAGTGGLTAYATNHIYTESNMIFTGGPSLRNTTTAQDGFAGALGTYSWRLRDAVSISWTGTYTSALAPTANFTAFSFSARRWDGSPSPNILVEYSYNGGTNWTTATSMGSSGVLNNAAFSNSSDWVVFNQTINSPIGLAANNFMVRLSQASGERVMIDNFSYTIFTPLPINLITFSTKADKNNQNLSWTYESPERFDYFEVEHSRDGQKFNVLDRISEGAFSSRAYKADYTHVRPGAGIHYYRLKMVDLDGSFIYSQVIQGKIEGSGSVRPLSTFISSEGLNVSIETSVSSLELRLVDQLGRSIYHSTQSAEAGIINIPVSNLGAGVYFLQVNADGVIETYKLVR
jgi:hypothetical protein